MGNLPIGQGLAVTPIQMAAAYSAIANGGILRPPHIVASVGGRRTAEPKGHRVISAAHRRVRAPHARGRARPGRHRLGRAHRRLRAGGQDRHGREAGRERRLLATRSSSPRSSASRRRAIRKLLVAVMVDEPQGDIYGGTIAAPGVQGDHLLRAQLPPHPAGLSRGRGVRSSVRLTDASTHEVAQPAAAVRGRQPPRRAIPRCGRGSSGRARAGRSTACATAARSPARPRRRSTRAARSATPRGCAPTTATGTGSTSSSSTRAGTGSCAARSSARSTRCRGGIRARARTSPTPRC